MPTITVKNIPDEIYEQLRQSAAANRRSINGEIIVCLERALRSRQINPEEVLSRAQALRHKTAGHPITDEEFSQAKSVRVS